MQVVPRLSVEPMRYEDIAAVQAIERQVFSSPWPKNAYASELSQNRQASYIVLRQNGDIVGYAGLWRVALEAHVTTIGVRAGDHSKGYGTVLFAALVQRAYALGARWITLEVRDTNDHAIRLYERFGFKAIGRRRGYYTDNGEDAVIMWSDSIHAPEFKRAFMAILNGLDVAGVGGAPRWSTRPPEPPRLETSCDETAAAVLSDGREIRSSVVSSQIALHAVHGGVVPELAARAHLEGLATVVDAALAPVPGGWDAIDAVAVTRGPGLAGCLIVGTMYATSAAIARGLPIVGVSHLAGHVYSAWLADHDLEPPYLALLVSGGHTECVVLRDHGVADRLAATRDDAAGEAFDKVARLLGLEYPGGPAIQRVAPAGDPTRFPLPRTRLDGASRSAGSRPRCGIWSATWDPVR